MKKALPDVQIDTPDWTFDHPSIHIERADPRTPAAAPVMARHPMHPFRASIRDDGNDLAPLLFETARQYVLRVPGLAALPLTAGTEVAPGLIEFGWLALRWGDPSLADARDARLSFWVGRRTPAGVRLDRTAVLIAGNRVVADGATASAGGSVGLRVVVHVGLPRLGRSAVRVTGFTASDLEQHLGGVRGRAVPARRVDDHRDGQPVPPSPPLTQQQLPQQPLRVDFPLLRRSALATAQAAFGFEVAPALHGLVPTPGLLGEYVINGVGQRGPAGARRVFAWTARLDPQRDNQVLPIGLIEQRSHMATAGLTPESVLTRDPASHGSGLTLARRSPTRDADLIDVFREDCGPLPEPLADERVEVLRSRVGNESTPDEPGPLTLPDELHALRSDDLAAAHAWTRGHEFFARFDAYGLDSEDYFRMARLPLRMRPRASFYYASNGETVNAQVSPTDQGQSLSAPFDAAQRPQLQVAFGAANLSHRDRRLSAEGRLRAQPLGLAADARWSWHEFGHVLNFASMGELEFRFAHSAGDALAAITADPDSDLSAPEQVRNLTFPWAMLRRSHARPALLGWCWCGQRSRLRQSLRDGPPPIPGGYFEEELMASSLFRLYESIGGAGLLDGVPINSVAVRRNASDYVVYLIMRAISLLGPAAIVPARTADAFVSALIDADVGTGEWNVKPTWPVGTTRPQQVRYGGAVHKVARWAFERQGLYATDDPTELREGPGLPPKVDVYIPGIGARSDGGYDAVDLGWVSAGEAPWHADAGALVANGANLCRVQVRNRGSQTAIGVGVRAWACPVTHGPMRWKPLDAAGGAGLHDVSSSGLHTFAFEQRVRGALLPRGPHYLLAEVSCAADRANTDPAAALPCGDRSTWARRTQLTHLVANDNNLGLRVVDFV